MRAELGQDVWYDQEVKGYVMLDLQGQLDGLAAIPEVIDVDGVQLQRKHEMHCSLVAARKLAGEDPQTEARIVDAVHTWLQTNTLSFDGFTGDVYVCHKPNDAGEEQTTVIAGVAIKGLTGLWQAVRHVSPDFNDPSLHITLYKSQNSPYGIGVNSAADLSSLCTRRNNLAGLVLPRL